MIDQSDQQENMFGKMQGRFNEEAAKNASRDLISIVIGGMMAMGDDDREALCATWAKVNQYRTWPISMSFTGQKSDRDSADIARGSP